MTNKQVELIKWIGTALIIVGVTLNVLNNPDLQKYIYPYNLYINTVGGTLLLYGAIVQRDWPYVALNSLVTSVYVGGVINVFYPLAQLFN